MGMMSTVSLWFQQEVWRWRSGAAVVWSGLLLLPVILLYLLLLHFHPLHPLAWITGSLYGVLSPSNWPCLMLIGITVLAVAVADAKHFTPIACVLRCRWEMLCAVLRPARLLHGTGHLLAGAVIAWSLSAVTGGRMHALTRPCVQDNNHGSMCLNEQHVFVVLHGAVVGWLYSLAFFLHGHTFLAFPHIQQSKFFRVKSRLLGVHLRSAFIVLKNMRWFCLTYFLCVGALIRWFITANMLISVDMEKCVDNMWGMLDMGLLWQAWLTGVAVHVMFSITTLLYSVYHTQAFTFPIEPQFEQERGRCLHDALAEQKNPLVQHLAYEDLYLLSRHCLDRRLLLFSLSQLGGHPHFWSAVSEQCLLLLNAFCSELVAFNTSILAGPMRQLGVDAKIPPPLNNNTGARNTTLNRSIGTDASGLSKSTPDQGADSGASAKEAAAPPAGRRRRLFPFLTAPLPDTASRTLYANTQPVVWAVQALSHLVTASYTEDRYGVVQKSLADILASLLNMHEAVEKHMKLASVSRKPRKNGGSVDENDDSSLRFAVKAALKTSIYRIITTFGTHLNAIPMTVDHKRRLGQFQEYRE